LRWHLSIYNRLTNFLKNTFQDRFKRYLIISLIILGIVIGFTSQGTAGAGDINFFYLPSCSHCDEQRPFNENLAKKYPSIQIVEHDATTPQGSALLSEMLEELGIEDEPEFPITIIIISENQAFISGWVSGGWESEETTGREIEKALEQCRRGNCPPSAGEKPRDTIVLPLIGEIVLSDYSLPALAVILGLVDGFNPCAMWVLVYLISVVATLRDRKRIWLICGSFVLASGVLYFLFMTVWLNAYLFIGYSRVVTIVVGLVALGGGILQVREVVKTKGAIVCEVTDEESRKKTMARIQTIVSSPITFGILGGIIALAFAVNSVEFLCSAAIPAVFTRVLSLSNLSTFQYYAYILLYDVFFMLDDLVIFGTAAFALTSSLGDRYAKYTRPVGATILIILGLLLLLCLYSSQFEFLKPICSVLW
jgi:thiol-disulfide isomerase/thioredoxin